MEPQTVYLADYEVVYPEGQSGAPRWPVDTLLYYSCEFGYGFPDWTVCQNVTCVKTSYGVIWRPRLSDCVGE